MADDDDLRRRLDLLGSRLDALMALEAVRQADKPVIQRPPTQWVDPAYHTRVPASRRRSGPPHDHFYRHGVPA